MGLHHVFTTPSASRLLTTGPRPSQAQSPRIESTMYAHLLSRPELTNLTTSTHLELLHRPPNIMARTYRGPGALPPSATAAQRPQPIIRGPHGTQFSVDLGLVYAEQLDDDAVILLPPEYIHNPDDSPDAEWRKDTQHQQALRVWKATRIYESLGESHPRLVS